MFWFAGISGLVVICLIGCVADWFDGFVLDVVGWVLGYGFAVVGCGVL